MKRPGHHARVVLSMLALLARAARAEDEGPSADQGPPTGEAAPFGVAIEGVLAADLLVAGHRESRELWSKHEWPPSDPEARDAYARRAKQEVYPGITPPWIGTQRLVAGSVDRVLESSNLNHSFVVGADLAMEIGTMRGAFLARGIVFGEEAGVWSQPFKMLDGILVEVRRPGGPWIPMNGVREFVNRMHAVEFRCSIDGLNLVRRDFAPTGIPAFFHLLDVTNTGDVPVAIELRLTVQANVRPMWHKPWEIAFGEDELREVCGSRFLVRDTRIDGIRVACGVAGPEPTTSATDLSNPFRTRGSFTWAVELPPGGTFSADLGTVQWSARREGRSDDPDSAALAMLDAVLPRARQLLEEHRAWMDRRVFGGVTIDCPEPVLADAFACAIYNLATLESDFRPYFPHRHLATCPERGYQLLFGIDTLYSSKGATMAGLGPIIRDTLLNHLHFAGQTGNREIHYYVDHLGRHGDRMGRAQETAQFLGTLREHVRLTGDLALARDHWPALLGLLDGVAARDRNGDGWPEGMTFPGLTRESGADTMLDAAVRAWWAHDAMAWLAGLLGDTAQAERIRARSDHLAATFERDWWMDAESTWAIALDTLPDGSTRKVPLEGYHGRSLHYPQAYGLARLEIGRRSLDRIAAEAVDSRGGYHAPAVTVWQGSLLAIGAFRHDRPELGIRLLRRAAENPTRLDKMLGGFSTVNTHPEHPASNWNKLKYNWGAGPFIEAMLAGLFGIEADAFASTLTVRPQVPAAWERCVVRGFRFGGHRVDLELVGDTWTLTHVGGDRSLRLGAAGMRFDLAPGDSARFPRVTPSSSP